MAQCFTVEEKWKKRNTVSPSTGNSAVVHPEILSCVSEEAIDTVVKVIDLFHSIHLPCYSRKSTEETRNIQNVSAQSIITTCCSNSLFLKWPLWGRSFPLWFHCTCFSPIIQWLCVLSGDWLTSYWTMELLGPLWNPFGQRPSKVPTENHQAVMSVGKLQV